MHAETGTMMELPYSLLVELIMTNRYASIIDKIGKTYRDWEISDKDYTWR